MTVSVAPAADGQPVAIITLEVKQPLRMTPVGTRVVTRAGRVTVNTYERSFESVSVYLIVIVVVPPAVRAIDPEVAPAVTAESVSAPPLTVAAEVPPAG